MKEKYGRHYEPNEERERKANFAEAHAIILKHNSDSQSTFVMGHNQFSDMVTLYVCKLLFRFVFAVYSIASSFAMHNLHVIFIVDRMILTRHSLFQYEHERKNLRGFKMDVEFASKISLLPSAYDSVDERQLKSSVQYLY